MSGGAEGPEDKGKERDGRRRGRRLELSGTQVVGAMLATMTGTLFASKLGVLGTVAGAAVMSVASTVGTAFYQYYLRRGGERLRDARSLAETASLRQAARPRPETPRPETPRAGAAARAPGAGTGEPVQATLPFLDPVPARMTGDTAGTGGEAGAAGHRAGGYDQATASEDVSSDEEKDDGAEAGESPGTGPRRSWKLYAAMAVGLFALVMGGVTVYEAIVGKPLSAVVNGDDGSGTTLGGGADSTDTPDGGGATGTPDPSSTGQNDGTGGDTNPETTPKPDQSTPSDDSTSGEVSGDSGDPTPAPSTGEGQTPAPGDDGALGDGSTEDDQGVEAPDVITPPGPAPSAAVGMS